jgi:hypothetical protein
MKIKFALLTALFLALNSIGFAQSETETIAPDVLVKNLYAARKAGSSPFFQTKNRAVVDKYFTKDFADLIWGDTVRANGEVGAFDFDPLYNAQDTKITTFRIGKPEYGEGNLNVADVPVTFKNMGKGETVLFRLAQDTRKNWKISDIYYPSNSESSASLKSILANAAGAFHPVLGEPYSIEENYTGTGRLQVGKTESVILQVGEQTGDYAAFCFPNASEAGRAVLAKCKDGKQCKFTGTVEFISGCKVPGLEATLSASGNLIKVDSLKLIVSKN